MNEIKIKRITQEELDELIANHELWVVRNRKEGARLILENVRIDNCIIKNRVLTDAIFVNVEMYDCIFYNVYCSQISISHSNIYECQILSSSFSYSAFENSNIEGCLFDDCNFSVARWFNCSFYRSKFIDTLVPESCLLENVGLSLPQACPSEGEFIGWKKAMALTEEDEVIEVIIKLLIPAEAARSSATSYKCRCNKALVLDIETLDGQSAMVSTAHSWWDSEFIYEIDKWVEVSDFWPDRFVECAPGIHFFVDRSAAVAYEF